MNTPDAYEVLRLAQTHAAGGMCDRAFMDAVDKIIARTGQAPAPAQPNGARPQEVDAWQAKSKQNGTWGPPFTSKRLADSLAGDDFELRRLYALNDAPEIEAPAVAPEPETWPIAKLTVREGEEQVSVQLYAPGLPVGEFDVFLEPDGNRWKSEAEESAALRDKLSGILTATANAIKGQPEPLTLHSWHDLAESAQALRADADRLDWLERNPRLAEIVIDGKATPAVYYAVSGAPGLKLREIIDGIMKVEAQGSGGNG